MSLAKPVIGVTSFVEAVRWGHWSSLAALTPFGYVRAVATAGGRPVQLPPDGDAVPDLRGGDVVQDLDGGNGSVELHGDGSGAVSEHEVVVREGSRLAGLLGARTAVVSEHHQANGRIGAGLEEVAWAEDGTVEALEDPGKRFAVGVLWHPERSESSELFCALVDEARRYRGAQA